jgi:hypothetical protein
MPLRRLAQVLSTALLIALSIAGLLFPDQIKWFQDNASSSDAALPIHTAHVRPVYAIIVLILGGIALYGAVSKEAKAQTNEPGYLGEEKFLEAYTEALTTTLEYLPLSSIFTPDDTQDAIRNILRNIVNIAEAYKSDNVEHRHAMNACWYQAVDAAELSETQLDSVRHFMDEGRTTYDKFLVLEEWAYLGGESTDPNDKNSPKHENPCVTVGFTLPVDSVSQYTLPGAPQTYNSKEITVVSDISSSDALKRLPGMNYAPVHQEMWKFFRDRTTYTSFVNFPVIVGDNVYGVISVQSKIKHFCSLQSTHDQNMFKSLKPFLVALALLESYSSN